MERSLYQTESKNVYTQRSTANITNGIYHAAVKVGSVIEFKYTTNRESEAEIDDWYFQGRYHEDKPIRCKYS